MPKSIYLILVAAVAVFAGCGKNDDSGNPADRNILCIVDGEQVSSGDVSRYADFRMAMWDFLQTEKNRKSKNFNKRRETFLKRETAAATNRVVMRKIMSAYCRAKNITPSREAVSRGMANLEKQIVRQRKSVEEFAKHLQASGLAAEFEADKIFAAQTAECLKIKFPQGDEITSNEVAAAKAKMIARNEIMAATNRIVYAHASNVLERVRQGGNFAKLADEFSEDETKSEGGDMGDCVAEAYKDVPGYWDAVSKVPFGMTSDLIKTDVGLEIVKVTPPDQEIDAKNGGPALKLARIYFRLAGPMMEYTDEEIASGLRSEKREAMGKAMQDDLLKSVKVELPPGGDPALIRRLKGAAPEKK